MASACAVVLLLVEGEGRAAVLDVAPAGGDLVFTWDVAGPQDILRGTTPDNLLPWQAAVTSPFTATGENALRGENAFYRLASGSNMGFRIERTFTVTDASRQPYSDGISLPERNSYPSAFALLAAFPGMSEIVWFDPTASEGRSAIRLVPGGAPTGEDLPLPHHGGIHVAFFQTTTITLVGSHDDAYAGPTAADVGLPGNGPVLDAVLPVPYHVRATTGWELLCGQPGLDWQDADGDTIPDNGTPCGRDTNADGLPDTGFSALTMNDCPPPTVHSALIGELDGAEPTLRGSNRVTCDGTTAGGFYYLYDLPTSFTLAPGDGLGVYGSSPTPGVVPLNFPFRPATW